MENLRVRAQSRGMRDHGIRSIHELLGSMSRKEIERRTSTGELIRVGRGWYALPFASDRVVRAIRAGGRLGCLSGCQFHRLWVPHHPGLHVAYGNGRRPSSTPGIHLHPAGKQWPTTAVWPVEDCIVQAARHHDVETALILVESALNKKLLSNVGAQDVIAQLPVKRRHDMRFLSEAESGSETRVRLFFQQRNVPVLPQVWLEGIGRVDLVVGDRLLIECDSEEHHRSKEDYENDRRRDLAARLQGFEPIRLSYHQIWLDWDATRASLLRLLRARKHIRRK